MRAELGELLRELGLPTLLVTHDFEGAAALADRVGVLVEGELRQVAPPADLVSSPADGFVASLAGGTRLEAGGTVYSTDEVSGPVSMLVYPVGGLAPPPRRRRLGPQPRARPGGLARAGREPRAGSGRRP